MRASDADIDARLGRYLRAMHKSKIENQVIDWDRSAKGKNARRADSSRRTFILPATYGNKFIFALKLACFNLFLLHYLLIRSEKAAVIHAVDLETALPAMVASKLTGRPFIYDIYDHYSDSRGLVGWLKKAADWADALTIRHANLVIIADECRLRQHARIDPQKLLIVENVPDIARPPAEHPFAAHDLGRRLKVGYLGTLEPQFRGLEHLCAAIRKLPFVELHIAGTGALEPAIRREAAACSRIVFHGPQSHYSGLKLMRECHILAGLYYLTQPNHPFAAPNKYFEHLLLGMPMLTTKGSPPGDRVEKHITGWAVSEDQESIEAALTEANRNPEGCREMGRNANRLWQRQYADYCEQMISGNYVAALQRMMRSGASNKIQSPVKQFPAGQK